MGPNSTQTRIHEQIRREHEELRQMLASVHQTLNHRSPSPSTATESLHSLSRQLREHFHEEEADGLLFEQIANHAPRLAPRIDALRQEHLELLQRVDQLAAQAGRGATPGGWAGLKADFQDFGKQLMHHESMENELLQDAYGRDIGSAD